MPLRKLLPSVAALLVSCGDDVVLRLVPCEESAPEFDIEQVSVLETAFAIKGGGDAVVLDANLAKIPEGAIWGVGSVDVLVAIPVGESDRANTGIPLTVQVWDAAAPGSEPFAVTQLLDPATLEWEVTEVIDDEGDGEERIAVRRAWWRFDFAEVVPESGMNARRYLVGVRWGDRERPLVGYSNYNRPCSLNWTDYDDGKGWVLNQGDTGNECAWPMLRVNSRIVVKKEKCD